MDGGWEVSETVFDPAVEDAGVPGLVEGVLLEGFCSGFAGRPFVSAVGGELGRFGNDELVLGQGSWLELGGLALDDWV